MAGRDSKGRFVAGIEVALVDRTKAPLRGLIANWDRLERSMKKAERAFEVAGKIKHAADGVEDFSRKTIGLLEKPLKTGMDFERQMSEVKANVFNGKMTEQTQKEFEALRQQARDLGATTWASASQAAEGMDILATSFADTDDKAAQMMEAMPGLLDVAKAGRESIATSAEITTATMSQFGLSADQTGRIGDVLIKTANSSSAGLTDMGEALKYAGETAHSAGISLEETSAMIGVLSNAGVKGSQAGTAIRAMLSGFRAPTKQGKSALAFLGINTKDKKGNLRPIEDLLKEIEQAMDKKFGVGKGGNRRAALMKAIVGEEAASSSSILTKSAATGGLGEAIAGNKGAAGTAKRVAEEMANNTAGAAAELDSALEELQLTVADQVLPTFRELIVEATAAANQFGAWAKEHPELVKNLMLAAGALGGIGLVLGPVLKGVSTLVTIFGTVVQVAGYVGTAVEVAASAFEILRLAVITNPIIAAVTAIAIAAYLIYDNWDTLKAWWTALWDKLPGPVQSAIRMVSLVVMPFIRLGMLLYENWEEVSTKFVDLWTRFGAPVVETMAMITAPILWLINAGAELVGGWDVVGNTMLSVWEGIKSVVGGTIKWIGEQIDWAGQQIEDLERSLPEWMTGRDRKVVSAANDTFRAQVAERMQAQGGPLQAQGAPIAAAVGDAWSKFTGNLKISVDSDGRVTNTALTTSGDPGFEVRVNNGGQAAA